MAKKSGRIREKLFWELEVRDRDGKLLTKRRVPFRSFLLQHVALLKGQYDCKYGTTCSGATTAKDTGGTDRAYPSCAQYIFRSGLPLKADVGEGDYGISLGTSDGANALTTYNLGAKIAHGTGSGQLSHGASSLEAPSNPSGMDWIIRLVRTFTNNSGATITVKEIGLIVKADDSGGVPRYFLTARDVISPSVSVPNGSTLTVRYIHKITVA